ncbi:hypothetical protein VPH35_130311 [Triticum aestivum]|uniref:Tf2-1-like SH3-like domain-containing protein n=1 Tax=Triticum turgidum subsp. durum TaxID=4567 RepID=A0A9R1C299_TRITD|nr:unnamed protein product [Triticum turgidum subsp. durum]
MKDQADQKRSERSFSLGDWVFVKLQPYVQVSVAAWANHTLSFKFFGPFQVTSRIGSVAYRLQLPEGSRVHPVFHVSLLRGALPPGAETVSSLPEPALPYSPPDFPEKVLARRLITKGKSKIPQVLIKWSSQLEALASWEDFFELRSRFPGAAVWGQAASEERGDVTADTASASRPEPTSTTGRLKRRKKPNKLFDPSTWEL